MRLDDLGKVESADILIIGGGIAGLVAANAAKDAAPDVDILVVEKAHVPYGGQANKGAGNINYLAPGDDPREVDRAPRQEDRRLSRGSGSLARIHQGERAELERFDSWGGGICRPEDGKIISLKWLPYLPSSMAAADIDMMNPLYRRARDLV